MIIAPTIKLSNNRTAVIHYSNNTYNWVILPTHITAIKNAHNVSAKFIIYSFSVIPLCDLAHNWARIVMGKNLVQYGIRSLSAGYKFSSTRQAPKFVPSLSKRSTKIPKIKSDERCETQLLFWMQPSTQIHHPPKQHSGKSHDARLIPVEKCSPVLRGSRWV